MRTGESLGTVGAAKPRVALAHAIDALPVARAATRTSDLQRAIGPGETRLTVAEAMEADPDIHDTNHPRKLHTPHDGAITGNKTAWE